MIYRVQLLRAVRQSGFIEIEAGSEREAREAALQLARMPEHKIAKAPEWSEDDIAMDRVEVTGITEAA